MSQVHAHVHNAVQVTFQTDQMDVIHVPHILHHVYNAVLKQFAPNVL